jgi:hypothetical protein
MTTDSSGPVEDLDLKENEINPNIDYNTTIALNWRYPCYANGEIKNFVIFYQHGDLSESKVVSVPVNSTQTNFSHPLELIPDTEYRIWVVARSNFFDGQNATAKKFTLTPGSKV